MTNEVQSTNNQVQKQPVSLSVAFTNKIMNELAAGVKINWTDEQKRLAQSYYMGIEQSLKNAEEHRGNSNSLPFAWSNVVIDSDLAQNIAMYIRFGIDMRIANSLWVIPRKDNRIKKYRLNFMLGHEGRKAIAMKYSLDKIVDIHDELVYSTDKFTIIKKDAKHPTESYELEITNPFDRGDVVGGFVYVQFENPSKNFLLVMSKKEINKHRAKAMTTKIWDEWYEAMARKTVIHAACKRITIDPAKIDANYKKWQKAEVIAESANAQEVVEAEANNGDVIDIVPEPVQEEQEENAKQQPAEEPTEAEIVEEQSATEPKDALGDIKVPF